MRRKKLTISALVLAAIIGFAGYYVNSAPADKSLNEAQKAGNFKTLIYCIARSPKTLSPVLGSDGPSFNGASRIMFNRLVENVPGSTEIEPALATSWEISPDATEYTFHLRHGVQFHSNDIFKPTRPMNADDVLFSFNRVLDENGYWFKVNNGTYPMWGALGLQDLIKSVTKVDDYTVKITLSRPDVSFLSTLVLDGLSIYSAEYAEQLKKAGTPELIDTKPIGTGPWKLDFQVADTALQYVANQDYWKGAPKIGTLIVSITPDSNARISKLITGACTFIDPPDSNNLDSVINKYNIQTDLKTGLNVAFLAYNNEDPKLKDPRVRKALDMAIDKKAIAKIVYNNLVLADNHVLTPTMLGYDKDAKVNQYDPKAAKALLAQAGYPNGMNIEIFVQPIGRSSNPDPRKTAELIQQDWKQIGVNATLKTMEFQEFLKEGRAGHFQAGTFGWSGDNGDSDNFFGPLLSSKFIGKNNYSRYNNPEFDALLAKAVQTSDHDQRVAMYKKAEQIFFRDQPMTIIGHSKILSLMSPRVVGYKQSPFGFVGFYGVDLLPEGQSVKNLHTTDEQPNKEDATSKAVAPKADAVKTEAPKADSDKSAAPAKADADKVAAPAKANADKAPAHKAEGDKAPAHKAEGDKAPAHKSEGEKAPAHKSDADKKAPAAKGDADKADKALALKADGDKAPAHKSDADKAPVHKADDKAPAHKDADKKPEHKKADADKKPAHKADADKHSDAKKSDKPAPKKSADQDKQDK